jgi:Helix-turn-helix domain
MAKMISIADAAEVLDLSSARVRLLASNGDLYSEKIAGRWLVDRIDVERRRRRGAAGGRRFAPQNAWALLRLASGEEADGIDPVVRSRLRRSLSLEDLAALAPRLERRAEVRHYDGHPGEIAHVLADERLVPSGISAARAVGLDVMAGMEADGYVSASGLGDFVNHHVLDPAASGVGNVTLRVVPEGVWDTFLEGLPRAPKAAVALDLADEADPRSRAAGEDLLVRLDRER